MRALRQSVTASVGFNGDYFNPRLTGGVAWDWADVDRFVAQLLFVLYGRACKQQTDTEYTGAQSTGGGVLLLHGLSTRKTARAPPSTAPL